MDHIELSYPETNNERIFKNRDELFEKNLMCMVAYSCVADERHSQEDHHKFEDNQVYVSSRRF